MKKSVSEKKLQEKDFIKIKAMIRRAKKAANQFKEANTKNNSFAIFFND